MRTSPVAAYGMVRRPGATIPTIPNRSNPVLVRPTSSFVSTACGRDIILGPSDVLEDDDPHVRAYPGMFAPVHVTVRGGSTHVEEATSRPGEKRNR